MPYRMPHPTSSRSASPLLASSIMWSANRKVFLIFSSQGFTMGASDQIRRSATPGACQRVRARRNPEGERCDCFVTCERLNKLNGMAYRSHHAKSVQIVIITGDYAIISKIHAKIHNLCSTEKKCVPQTIVITDEFNFRAGPGRRPHVSKFNKDKLYQFVINI